VVAGQQVDPPVQREPRRPVGHSRQSVGRPGVTLDSAAHAVGPVDGYRSLSVHGTVLLPWLLADGHYLARLEEFLARVADGAGRDVQPLAGDAALDRAGREWFLRVLEDRTHAASNVNSSRVWL